MPAAKALAVLSQRFGESVWRLIFTELEAAVHGDLLLVAESSSPADSLDLAQEAERSWRDPSALRLRTTVDKWSRGVAGPTDMSQVRWS